MEQAHRTPSGIIHPDAHRAALVPIVWAPARPTATMAEVWGQTQTMADIAAHTLPAILATATMAALAPTAAREAMTPIAAATPSATISRATTTIAEADTAAAEAIRVAATAAAAAVRAVAVADIAADADNHICKKHQNTLLILLL